VGVRLNQRPAGATALLGKNAVARSWVINAWVPIAPDIAQGLNNPGQRDAG